MQNVANMKRLRNFENFNYGPKSVSMVVDGEGFPISQKLEEFSKWQTMTGHKFSDFSESLSDDLLAGKTDSVEDIKKEFEEQANKKLGAFLQKAMMADLQKAAELYKKLETAPVAFILRNGKMDEIRAITADLVQGWINSTITEKLVGVDMAQGIFKVFQDIEERVESFSAVIVKLSQLKIQIQDKYQKELTEEDFKRFEENLSTIRSQATLAALRDHSNYSISGKALYSMHTKSYTIDELLDLLKKGE